MLLRVRRPFLLAGRELKPGDLVDLDGLDLPVGRAGRLVSMRLGELVEDERHTCPACDRSFATAQAVTVHMRRAHTDKDKE